MSEQDTTTDRINALTRTLVTERKLKDQYRGLAAANRRWAEDTEQMLEESKLQLRKAEQRLDDTKRGYNFILKQWKEDSDKAWCKIHSLEQRWARLKEHVDNVDSK